MAVGCKRCVICLICLTFAPYTTERSAEMSKVIGFFFNTRQYNVKCHFSCTVLHTRTRQSKVLKSVLQFSYEDIRCSCNCCVHALPSISSYYSSSHCLFTYLFIYLFITYVVFFYSFIFVSVLLCSETWSSIFLAAPSQEYRFFIPCFTRPCEDLLVLVVLNFVMSVCASLVALRRQL